MWPFELNGSGNGKKKKYFRGVLKEKYKLRNIEKRVGLQGRMEGRIGIR